MHCSDQFQHLVQSKYGCRQTNRIGRYQFTWFFFFFFNNIERSWMFCNGCTITYPYTYTNIYQFEEEFDSSNRMYSAMAAPVNNCNHHACLTWVELEQYNFALIRFLLLTCGYTLIIFIQWKFIIFSFHMH